MTLFSPARLRTRLLLLALIAVFPAFAVIEYAAAFAGADQMLWPQRWLLWCVSLAAFGAAVIGGEVFVLRPILMLTAVTQRLAVGDFSTRAQLTRGAPGISELAGAINKMAMLLDAQWRQRDRAEHSLREAEERMRFALEAAGIGIWDADMKTGAVRWSAISEAQHGLPAGTFGGTFDAFVNCIHFSDRQEVQESIDRATREHTDPHLLYRTTWPDGSLHWVRGSGRIVYDEAGVPVRAAGVGMDVTERQLLEAQIRQSQKMDAVGQLAGGIAHDFNNLLTAIHGYAELLADSLPEADQRRADAEEIKRAADRAASLTRQLLAFSRKQILVPQVLRLGDAVAEVAPMLRRLISESIDLQTITHDSGRVKADAGQIEQVLVNLTVNARDAMPNGGRLTIETADVSLDEHFARQHAPARPGPHVVLAVSDTGHGMDAVTQSRVFEPFFTTKAKGQGTGLGLATVYGIVKQSGGHIWVYSELGRGSIFKVYLPQTDEPVQTARAPSVAVNDVRGTETILMVEDEDLVRGFVEKVLSRLGYTVHAVAHPVRAIELARMHQATIQLLLTDVVLPGMSGRTLAADLVHQHPESKVLYMSGYTDDAIVHHGVLEAGTWFIQKPFSADALAQKVREILDSPVGPI